jgi:hypothetical protein
MAAPTVARPRALSLNGAVDAAFRSEPRFAAAGLAMAALMLPTAVAALLDLRTVADVNVWAKPLKFEAALAIYLLTLAWFARWLPAGLTERRWYRVYAGVVVAAAAAEIVWIGAAAWFGVPSHFNRSSAVWSALYGVMGVLAVTLTSMSLVFGLAVARNPASGLAPAVKAGVAIGLVLTFALTLLVAGFMSAGSGHLVGGNLSDAEALPVFGWARDGGDLRVAHFFATHAMHIVPALGLVSAAVFGGARRVPVWMAGAAFAAFVLHAFIEALRGQPFLPSLG